MSFMQQQITARCLWIEIDGDNGTTFVPADVVGGGWTDGEEFTRENDAFDTRRAIVRDYYEGSRIWEIKTRMGYGARLSAPGYMDCTEWSVFDTEQAAQEYLDETYGDETEDDTDE